jgi:hypothetical protein
MDRSIKTLLTVACIKGYGDMFNSETMLVTTVASHYMSGDNNIKNLVDDIYLAIK